jgi:L-gulonate 5-dehydrogenase
MPLSRAAVWTGVNRVEVKERSVSEPGRGEVVLRVRAAGICGTDLHILSGTHPQARPPLVPGHEFAGEVHEIGEGVDASYRDARVGADSYRGCGECLYCQSNNQQLCEQGTCEYGINIDGGWQEFVVIPAANLYRLPDSVSLVDAGAGCILNCPMAAVEMVGIEKGDSVLILGDGPSSLILLQLARIKGAGRVVVSGHRKRRLKLAEQLGADLAINTHELNIADALEGHAGKLNVVIDAVGKSETMALALRVAGKRARVHLFGLPEGLLSELPMDEFLWKELTLTGSTGAPSLWPRAVDYLEQGSLQVSPVISHRFPIERAQESVDYILSNPSEVVKAVFEFP